MFDFCDLLLTIKFIPFLARDESMVSLIKKNCLVAAKSGSNKNQYASYRVRSFDEGKTSLIVEGCFNENKVMDVSSQEKKLLNENIIFIVIDAADREVVYEEISLHDEVVINQENKFDVSHLIRIKNEYPQADLFLLINIMKNETLPQTLSEFIEQNKAYGWRFEAKDPGDFYRLLDEVVRFLSECCWYLREFSHDENYIKIINYENGIKSYYEALYLTLERSNYRDMRGTKKALDSKNVPLFRRVLDFSFALNKACSKSDDLSVKFSDLYLLKTYEIISVPMQITDRTMFENNLLRSRIKINQIISHINCLVKNKKLNSEILPSIVREVTQETFEFNSFELLIKHTKECYERMDVFLQKANPVSRKELANQSLGGLPGLLGEISRQDHAAFLTESDLLVSKEEESIMGVGEDDECFSQESLPCQAEMGSPQIKFFSSTHSSSLKKKNTMLQQQTNWVKSYSDSLRKYEGIFNDLYEKVKIATGIVERPAVVPAKP